jgi:hypothetical protein
MNNPDHSDPIGCQQAMGLKRLLYRTWHTDADRRSSEGQQSFFCLKCERWRWEDERCPQFIYGGNVMNDEGEILSIDLKCNNNKAAIAFLCGNVQ